MLLVFICVNLDSLNGSKEADLEKKPRRGIRSVENAFRILSVMQASQQAMASKEHRAAGGPDDEGGTLIETQALGGKTESRD